MLKFAKISILSIALIAATNSALIAENCSGSECSQVATCEAPNRVKKSTEMTRLAKIRADIQEIIKPGGPSKAAEQVFDKVFGKDTFSRKVATGAFPKIVTVLTVKIMVNKMFENLKVNPKVQDEKLTGLGKFAEQFPSLFVNQSFDTSESSTSTATDSKKKLTGATPTLLGSLLSNHQVKEVTDILAGTVLAVWLTNK